jgi:hypothetical protein
VEHAGARPRGHPTAVDPATGAVIVEFGNYGAIHAVDGATGRTLWTRTGLHTSHGYPHRRRPRSGLRALRTESRLRTTRLSDGAALTTCSAPSCPGVGNPWGGSALANGVLYATSRCGLVANDIAAQQTLGVVFAGAGLNRPVVVAGAELNRPVVAVGRLFAGNGRRMTACAPQPPHGVPTVLKPLRPSMTCEPRSKALARGGGRRRAVSAKAGQVRDGRSEA